MPNHNFISRQELDNNPNFITIYEALNNKVTTLNKVNEYISTGKLTLYSLDSSIIDLQQLLKLDSENI